MERNRVMSRMREQEERQRESDIHSLDVPVLYESFRPI